MQAYKDAVASLKADLEDAGAHVTELEEGMKTATIRMHELTVELQEANAAALLATATTNSRDVEIRGLKERVESILAEGEGDLRRERRRNLEIQGKLILATKEIQGLKDESRVHELEADIANQRNLLAGMTAQRDETALLLDEQNQEVERLNDVVMALQQGRTAAIDEAVSATMMTLHDATAHAPSS